LHYLFYNITNPLISLNKEAIDNKTIYDDAKLNDIRAGIQNAR